MATLAKRHAGIGAPLVGSRLLVVEVVEVVLVGIGLHLEGVEPIAGITEMVGVGQGGEPVVGVAQIEQPPGIVARAGLVEVDALVVVQDAGVTKGISVLLVVGNDGAEECQGIVAPTYPVGLDDDLHVVSVAGPRCAEYH